MAVLQRCWIFFIFVFLESTVCSFAVDRVLTTDFRLEVEFDNVFLNFANKCMDLQY